MDPEINQTVKQKIATLLANPDNIQAIIELVKMSIPQEEILGDNEYQTIVNAVKLDTRGKVLVDLIAKIDFIKQGGLNQIEL